MSRPAVAHRIVVGVDRSFAGMQALRRAVQLARREGAQVDAVRAVVAVPAPAWARAATIRRFARDLEQLSR